MRHGPCFVPRAHSVYCSGVDVWRHSGWQKVWFLNDRETMSSAPFFMKCTRLYISHIKTDFFSASFLKILISSLNSLPLFLTWWNQNQLMTFAFLTTVIQIAQYTFVVLVTGYLSTKDMHEETRGRWVRGEKDKREREKRQAAEGRSVGGQTTLKHGQVVTSRLESFPSPWNQLWLRFRYRQSIQTKWELLLKVALFFFLLISLKSLTVAWIIS